MGIEHWKIKASAFVVGLAMVGSVAQAAPLTHYEGEMVEHHLSNLNKNRVRFNKTSSNSAGTVGIRNFRELMAALTSLTGVRESEIRNQAFLAEAETRLATSGDVDALSAPMHLTIGKLSFLFCEQFIENESSLASDERRVHRGVNFSGRASEISSEVRETSIVNYARAFWRRNPTEEERSVLMISLEEGIAGARGQEAVSQAFVVPCTIALSSMEVFHI